LAIKITVQLHASPDIPRLEGAYLMILPDHQRVVDQLIMRIVVFASEGARDKMRAIVSDIRKYEKILGDAQKAGAPAKFPGEGEEQEAAVLAYRQAEFGLGVAKDKFRTFAALQPVDVPQTALVPADEIPGCLKDGQPDLALCYEWATRWLEAAGHKVEAV
jgi:hypothetical protein